MHIRGPAGRFPVGRKIPHAGTIGRSIDVGTLRIRAGANVTKCPKSVSALLSAYDAFQESLPVCEPSNATAELGVFDGNKTTPIHRWFGFKEGFSHRLFEWIVSTYHLLPSKYDWIVDPFCGVGTTLLSAQLALPSPGPTQLLGVERNPFIKFVAKTKLNWFLYDIDRIKQLLPRLLRPLDRKETGRSHLPELSTIQNPSVFSRDTLEQLLGYRDRIRLQCEDTPEKDFFLLGWSAVIEKVSGVRRDGRALRFVQKYDVPTVRQALSNQWLLMLRDLQTIRSRFQSDRSPVQSTVHEGDGRQLQIPGLEDNSIDLLVYSPPYINNIDYTEVYKLELWMMGLVETGEDFLALRRKTFRSHPSVRFPRTATLDTFPNSQAHELRSQLLDCVPQDRNTAWRHRLFQGYIDDMVASLTRQHAVCKPGAFAFCVVGNSMHGRKGHPIVVATDLIVAALAQLAGFEVVQMQVTRQLRRRDHGNKFLRETILALRKPP